MLNIQNRLISTKNNFKIFSEIRDQIRLWAFPFLCFTAYHPSKIVIATQNDSNYRNFFKGKKKSNLKVANKLTEITS